MVIYLLRWWFYIAFLVRQVVTINGYPPVNFKTNMTMENHYVQ